jgi:hypothetical protein
MEKNSSRKILVIGLLFLFLGASATLGVSKNTYTNEQTPGMIKQTIQAIHKDIIGKTNLAGNVKISTNPETDNHPRITTDSRGQTIVVFEQQIDIFTQQIPVVYSKDKGQTWTIFTIFDSYNFTDGSGTLQYPDIVYNGKNDTLYIAMIDPYAESYNNEMSFILGNIATAVNASWYGLSGTTSEGYYYCAAACTDNYYLGLTSENYPGYESILGLGYYTPPDFEHPPVMGGYYYDGNSLVNIWPVAEIEMGWNANRIFIVCESLKESVTKIVIKSNVNNEALMTSGEQQNAMDKYADIEQWPGEFLGDGTDPDVSGSENKVCVVYVQDGNVKCSYSTCAANTEYEPGFSWQVSTVETGASTPSVYMQGNTVYCAYVKDGNLYLKISSDAGATWGPAEQRNDVSANGKVVANKGAVAVGKSGIVFTDNRNGKNDIYISPISGIPGAPNAPTITGPAKGGTGKPVDYTVTTTDPEGDTISYYIDWGDGTNSGWKGPFASGTGTTESHTWSADGDYTIKAKAKDTAGHESDYGTLTVTMPVSLNLPFHQLIEKIFERFPHAFPILRQLLGY